MTPFVTPVFGNRLKTHFDTRPVGKLSLRYYWSTEKRVFLPCKSETIVSKQNVNPTFMQRCLLFRLLCLFLSSSSSGSVCTRVGLSSTDAHGSCSHLASICDSKWTALSIPAHTWYYPGAEKHYFNTCREMILNSKRLWTSSNRTSVVIWLSLIS